MAVTALNRQDFRTIATFRQRHLKALGDLFVQVLKLCRAAGLVKLGHVSLDGTKVQAYLSLANSFSFLSACLASSCALSRTFSCSAIRLLST